jgi:hypothetical protein
LFAKPSPLNINLSSDRFSMFNKERDIFLALDQKLEKLVLEKAKLAAALRSPQHEDFVEASIRQFCATANARLQACADFDAKRQFLVDYVERVIYNRYNVTIVGSVPVQSVSGEPSCNFGLRARST